MQDFNTPMMKQYVDIKKQYQDCLLFFRMGDFYELFLEDAYTGAKVLDIVLTSRSKGKDGRVPMAGVPYHAVDSYISKLVKAGHKVAICEQVSEPNKYGIVDREVIRIVTPGTVLDDYTLREKEHNYIMSLVIDKNTYGLAVADISTGLFQIMEINSSKGSQTFSDELSRIKPSECVLSETHYNDVSLIKEIKSDKDVNIYCFHEGEYYAKQWKEILSDQFGKQLSLQSEFKKMKISLQAAAILIGYLKYTQKDTLPHFKSISLLSSKEQMVLDQSTILNLELFSTLRNKETKGTLINFLDSTTTSMGGRKLREWLKRPLTSASKIQKRHDAVEEILQNVELRKHIQNELTGVTDTERILSKMSLSLGNARDLVSLKESLKKILHIKQSLNFTSTDFILTVRTEMSDKIQTVISLIETTIVDEPPITITEGRMIREGIDSKLDMIRESICKNKEWMSELEKQERQRTGISSLKIRFNKVFGFYIEISKANLDLVPKEYIRKQTLVNAERFITEALKEKEELILSGEEVIFDIEHKIYKNLLEEVLTFTDIIQQASNAVAKLDCIVVFAELAEKHNFTRAEMVSNGDITITDGKHPVVEQSIGDEQFVPNDTHLDQKSNQLHLITGPNMAGKSVYIRQVAVIVLLNQIGSFVPAKQAKLSVVDRIFVRSGASDMISEGLSTFMVEMVETAQILHKATSKSLVIMDEIGRGTSTYDGISIAWAIAEYIVRNKKVAPKTLFATHYHELQELEYSYPKQIKNYHMAIEDENGKPVFLYRLLPGGTSHSYGIAVAELAGIPEDVIESAYKVLHDLEKRDHHKTGISTQTKNIEKKPNPFIKKILECDTNNLTPIEALSFIADLQKELHENNS